MSGPPPTAVGLLLKHPPITALATALEPHPPTLSRTLLNLIISELADAIATSGANRSG